MVKKFRSINFNTFMNFMVNPFVSDIRATKGFRLGGLVPISAVLSPDIRRESPDSSGRPSADSVVFG